MLKMAGLGKMQHAQNEIAVHTEGLNAICRNVYLNSICIQPELVDCRETEIVVKFQAPSFYSFSVQ